MGPHTTKTSMRNQRFSAARSDHRVYDINVVLEMHITVSRLVSYQGINMLYVSTLNTLCKEYLEVLRPPFKPGANQMLARAEETLTRAVPDEF